MMDTPYKPIDCDFYDELESLSTLRKPVDIVYRDENEDEIVVRDTIENLFTANHEEYMTLKRGASIRLDAIISVNGKKPGK